MPEFSVKADWKRFLDGLQALSAEVETLEVETVAAV
jgi:hypothetical protein